MERRNQLIIRFLQIISVCFFEAGLPDATVIIALILKDGSGVFQQFGFAIIQDSVPTTLCQYARGRKACPKQQQPFIDNVELTLPVYSLPQRHPARFLVKHFYMLQMRVEPGEYRVFFAVEPQAVPPPKGHRYVGSALHVGIGRIVEVVGQTGATPRKLGLGRCGQKAARQQHKSAFHKSPVKQKSLPKSIDSDRDKQLIM